MLKFDRQHDVILNADGSINISKLMTEKDYWSSKRDLVESLWQEQANHHTVWSGIGTLFGDAMANKYSWSDCPDVEQPKFNN